MSFVQRRAVNKQSWGRFEDVQIDNFNRKYEPGMEMEWVDHPTNLRLETHDVSYFHHDEDLGLYVKQNCKLEFTVPSVEEASDFIEMIFRKTLNAEMKVLIQDKQTEQEPGITTIHGDDYFDYCITGNSHPDDSEKLIYRVYGEQALGALALAGVDFPMKAEILKTVRNDPEVWNNFTPEAKARYLSELEKAEGHTNYIGK